MKPSDDAAFMAMLASTDEGQYLARISTDWEIAVEKLDEEFTRREDEIDALERAIEYAVLKRAEEAAGEDEGLPTAGWYCSGCKTGTLSRCLACDEPTCGNCLVVHVCGAVTA